MSTLILVRKIWGIKKSKKRSKKTRQAREKMHWVQQLYILLVSILNVKGTSNLIKGVSSHNVCFGIKLQQIKKIFVIQYHKVDFSQNSSVPFHQVPILNIQFHVCV